jgi:Asp/Glu/hydantoin racemase
MLYRAPAFAPAPASPTASASASASVHVLDDELELARYTRWVEGRAGERLGVSTLQLAGIVCAACAGIIDECRRAMDEDEAAAIVLGCAGMADLADRIQQAIGIPVVEGVTAAVKLAETIVGMGLGTSKRGDLDYPLPKRHSGTVAHLTVTKGCRPTK